MMPHLHLCDMHCFAEKYTLQLGSFPATAQVADIADVVRQRADALMLTRELAIWQHSNKKASWQLRRWRTSRTWCGSARTRSCCQASRPRARTRRRPSACCARSPRASRSGAGARAARTLSHVFCQKYLCFCCVCDEEIATRIEEWCQCAPRAPAPLPILGSLPLSLCAMRSSQIGARFHSARHNLFGYSSAYSHKLLPLMLPRVCDARWIFDGLTLFMQCPANRSQADAGVCCCRHAAT